MIEAGVYPETAGGIFLSGGSLQICRRVTSAGCAVESKNFRGRWVRIGTQTLRRLLRAMRIWAGKSAISKAESEGEG